MYTSFLKWRQDKLIIWSSSTLFAKILHFSDFEKERKSAINE